jgi:hypothetical protein
MTIQIEQISPTHIWIHDGPITILDFDTSSGKGVTKIQGQTSESKDKNEDEIVSTPPPGCFKVTNCYVDENGKFIVKWSDTPEGV